MKHGVARCLLLSGNLLVCVLAGHAAAATVFVKPPGAGGSDANDGQSWATAKATPQAAVLAAAPGDEVWIAAGTYDGPVRVPAGVSLLGGFEGGESSADERVRGVNETIVRLPTAASGAVIRLLGEPDESTVIDGLTITGGRPNGANPNAGGLEFSGGSPIIRYNVFRDNSSQNYAGGVTYYEGSPIIEYNTFIGNRSRGGTDLFEGGSGGGAIWGYGGAPVVRYNEFRSNRADEPGVFFSAEGGAIWQYEGVLTLIGNTFESNFSEDSGGAVWQYEGALIAASNVFAGNIAQGEFGGAIWCYATDMWVANNTFVNNSSLLQGGAVYCFEGPMRISNNIFAGHDEEQAVTTAIGTGTVTSNLFYDNFSDHSAALVPDGSIFGDPLFTNPGDGDYTLLPGSPAIDAGDAGEVPVESMTDREGNPRLSGAAPDIGAYEFIGGASCPADFNNDGGVDGADVEAFYLAWEAALPESDVNQDGGIDGGDVETFFVAWENGGC